MRPSGVGSRFGGFSRLFGEGEPWLRWGVPIARVAGCSVRVHWLFVILLLAGVIFTLPHHQSGIGFRLPILIALFVLALAHEIGHVVACRRAGGEADEIVLWPLGGLGATRPPHDWSSELRVAMGGPIVNAALMPVLAGALYAFTRSWVVAMPNPLDPWTAVFDLSLPDGTTPWWLVGLWATHAANTTLLAFNLLVPMHPLDAGRIVQCLIWRRSGYHRSVWVAAHVGLVASVVLALMGVLFADGKLLIALGAFGAAVCWSERRRCQFLAGEDPVLDAPVPEPDDPDPLAEPDQADLDRILEKISRVGMDGLSGRERRVLKRATQRSRETEGGARDSDE